MAHLAYERSVLGLPKLRGLVQNQVGTYMKVISKTILYGLLLGDLRFSHSRAKQGTCLE